MAAAVLVVTVVYGALAYAATAPVVFDDELIYWSASRSVADGLGIEVRGDDYAYGIAALYPVAVAPLLWLFSDRETAYALVKLLNALLFASAAAPIYLLARRLLGAWSSAIVAGLSIAIPSAMYVSVVMAESLAYPACAWALLAMVLALERPSIGRQALALGAVLSVCTVRLQFAVLVPAYVLAQFSLALLVRSRRARLLRTLAPSLVVLAGGVVAALVVSSLGERSPADGLGGYTGFLRDYEVLGVPEWLVYQFSNLSLYLAVLPVAVAPIVMSSFAARVRATGSDRHAAFIAVFSFVNAGVLLLAASFDSTEHAIDRLHDRYVFYVVPLWLIVLFAWLEEGARLPRSATVAGIGLVLVLAAAYPVGQVDADSGGRLFDGVATTPWAAFEEAVAGESSAVVRLGILAFAVAMIALVVFVPRPSARAVSVVVLAWFLVTSTLAWSVALDTSLDEQRAVFASPDADRSWLETRVPSGATVVALFISCPDGGAARRGFFQTEFFNDRPIDAVHVGEGYAYSLESTPVAIDAGLLVREASGAPVTADYLLTQPGVRAVGRRVARGTSAHLVLWEVGGPVRMADARSTGALASAACGG